MQRWVREDMPHLIARATGCSTAELLAMPVGEYRAWERHFGQGLAHEVWTPLLLVYLIEAVTAALGSPANLHRLVPWLTEDVAMRTPAQRADRVAAALRESTRKRAREALAAMRVRSS